MKYIRFYDQSGRSLSTHYSDLLNFDGTKIIINEKISGYVNNDNINLLLFDSIDNPPQIQIQILLERLQLLFNNDSFIIFLPNYNLINERGAELSPFEYGVFSFANKYKAIII